MTEFADIADPYQAGANLATYAAAGHDRVLLKATEGTWYTNPSLREWWAAAGTHGLARGLYHFAEPLRSTGDVEADHFAAVVKSLGGLGHQDWVCFDTEQSNAQNRAAVHARAFTARLAKHGIAGGTIYSGAYYLADAELRAVNLPAGWRFLHLANYGPIGDQVVPMPAGWDRSRLVARQYTDKASTAGIPGPCDRSRVCREWLPVAQLTPKEDDVITEQDKADIVTRIVTQIFARLRAEVFSAVPPIRQPNSGSVLGTTYNKAGDIQGKQADAAAVALATKADVAAEFDTVNAELRQLRTDLSTQIQALATTITNAKGATP